MGEMERLVALCLIVYFSFQSGYYKGRENAIKELVAHMDEVKRLENQ